MQQINKTFIGEKIIEIEKILEEISVKTEQEQMVSCDSSGDLDISRYCFADQKEQINNILSEIRNSIQIQNPIKEKERYYISIHEKSIKNKHYGFCYLSYLFLKEIEKKKGYCYHYEREIEGLIECLPDSIDLKNKTIKNYSIFI